MKTPEETREQLDCGRSIRKARKENGWTQAQLADAIGVKRSVVSKYENGLVEISTSKLQRIKEALGIEFNESKLSLNDLRDAIYEDAVAHGLWEEKDGPYRCADIIAKEASELIKEAEHLSIHIHGSIDYTSPCSNYAEELADVIIASLSVAGKLGIDIDAAVRRKMEINKARPWNHGKENEGEA